MTYAESATASQRPRLGMLNAPSFIQTSEASDVNPQAISLSNDQQTTNARSHLDHEHVDPPNTSVAVYKSSPESAFVLGPGSRHTSKKNRIPRIQ